MTVRLLSKTYDWSTFLGNYFRKMSGITKYHHFRFCMQKAGTVYCKEFVNSTEVEFDLLKNAKALPSLVLPPDVVPEGLDAARRNYLFNGFR